MQRHGSETGSPALTRKVVVAFLSESSPSFERASLTAQKASVDAAAAAVGMAIDAYVVEVSPTPAGRLWSAAVRDLLLRARAGGLGAVVVAGIGRLAVERDAALLVAVHLAECGVRVVEAQVEDRRSRPPVRSSMAARIPHRRSRREGARRPARAAS